MSKKVIWFGLLAMLSMFAFSEETTTDPAADEQAYAEWASGIWNALERKTGQIDLPSAHAKLNVPDSFYYLNSKDTETVLAEVWGNPPGGETLGMLFPSDLTPFDQGSWAVTIEYEEDGYVSDEDAADIDYAEILDQMKSDTQAASEDRVAQGYEPIELVGWAAKPFYDAATHKLHWAKEIKFGDQATNTLNYNIRVLGRQGVLVLNFIASVDQKEMIESKLDTVLNLAEFEQGNQYADFDPEMDQVAAYGIGALVAGKLIAKTGFLAVALIFLKKFGVFIVVGLAALGKGLYSKKKKSKSEVE